MIISHRWLGRHLADLPEPQVVRPGLEQLGLEVIEVKSYGSIYQTVELVEVVARQPHPDSHHLSLVDVRRGDQSITRIVTGASNGLVGERLWYAPPGTTLPDGRTLGVKDLRGISSPGMLLSAEELGYQAVSGDLWVWPEDQPLGTTFLDVMGGLDVLYEVELTPNIAQYLQSVHHLAQELSAIWGISLVPEPDPFHYQEGQMARVTEPQACPLYGLVRFKIRPGGVSPLWMQTLLRAVGHRIIHPAVDVTNFVMWDWGEPLHAFDARQVHGPIIVRYAEPGETLTLLDGQDKVLGEHDLVIADQDKILALAGIMGGQASGIGPDTEEILLECAHFRAETIFQSAKRLSLSTDAQAHFGRGTDPQAVSVAPTIVKSILAEAQVLQEVEDSTLVGGLPSVRQVLWEPERIRNMLGVRWSDERLKTALSRLGYQFQEDLVRVPVYRHDVHHLADLAEDVERYYGLKAVPTTLPRVQLELAKTHPEVAWHEAVRDLVASAGFDEVMTRTMVAPDDNRLLGLIGDDSVVAISNPLRVEESQMRQSLLPSLLSIVRYNRSRHDEPLRIFEVGTVFSRMGEQVCEDKQLGVVLTLESHAALFPSPTPSIYDLTGLVDWLSQRLGWEVARSDFSQVPSFLHPGRAQRITHRERSIGYLGELRPKLAAQYRARRLGVLIVQLVDDVPRTPSKPHRPSRFPAVHRDLSLIVPPDVSYEALYETLNHLEIPILQDLRAIDRFAGEFGDSLTVRFSFGSETDTLTDAEVDDAMSRIMSSLALCRVVLRQ